MTSFDFLKSVPSFASFTDVAITTFPTWIYRLKRKCLGKPVRATAKENIAEEMKATDQLGWVLAMNSIRSRAEEIVLSELVYC